MKITLQTLWEHHLYAKFSKYEFLMTKIHFLRHIVSHEGIQVDPHKVEAISKWLRPSIVTKIWSFLGMASYYCQFVKDFLRIATPLTRLTQKGVKFIWTEEYDNSFQKLKECLTTNLMLALWLRTKGYIA